MSKKENHTIEDIKANFLATMSHEMRTPMQSVYGLLELIELEETSGHVKEMVKTAKDSANSLLDILDDVLEFSKMDAGKLSLDDFEVPLRTLVQGVKEALAVHIQEDTLVLLDHFEEDVPFVVRGDPQRLRQILMNLVGNALKFTKEGQVLISVKTLSKDPLRIRFEVSDTGIGIAEETCKTLFQPFHQADNSTAREYGGTGLGLSICKKLVELMDGAIGVKSTQGEGSTFWFEIPTQAVDTNLSDLELPDLTGLMVLSVEDHPQGAQEIVTALSSMGAHVESCPSIKDALMLMEHHIFDVGIIDQGLPDGEGLTLIRTMLDTYPFMGGLMYTARDDSGLQNTLHSLGVAYVAKPASRFGLAQAVLDAARKISGREDLGAGSKRLLIADDTPSIRDLLKRQLATLGVHADIVTNGQELIDALRTQDYGLVITDLHMPDIDGYDVIKIMRQKEIDTPQHLPIIAFTADVQIAQRQVYLKHGFDECLLKPATLGHLRRLLIRWGIIRRDDQDENYTSLTSTQLYRSQSPINLKALEHQLGVIDDQAVEMLNLFIDMTRPVIQELQEAGEKKDIKKICALSHSLKGSARSAGAQKLGNLASELQKKTDNNTLDLDLITGIGEAFEHVIDYVQRIQARFSPDE